MEYSHEELRKFIYSPELMQKEIYKWLNMDNKVINTATNPFVTLIEAAVSASYNATIEAKNTLRTKYPSLSISPDHLYHHMSDDELANMFAIPSQTKMFFQVNIRSLMTKGYRRTLTSGKADYVETTIPKGTYITIADLLTLTILNDINIKLYDNGSVYVEQIANDNDFAINNLSTLKSKIISNKDSISFILFETYVKQVRVRNFTGNISPSTGFSKVIQLEDLYCYSDFTYKNSSSNAFNRLPIYLNEEYINPRQPGVYLNIADMNKIIYKVPDVYIIEGNVSGNVNIMVYETKGKTYIPLNRYRAEDYVITLENVHQDESSSTIKNIEIMAISNGILEGGKSSYTYDELRKSIIFNTTGDIDLPITEQQVYRLGEMDGYIVNKVLDILTNRVYTASKSLPNFNSEEVYVKMDMLFNTIQLVLSDYLDHPSIMVNENQFSISSNCMFKEQNGIIKILEKNELDNFNNMSRKVKIDYLKNNKILYNPYYYVIEKNDKYSSCKVYDLDRPFMRDTKVDAKNINVDYRVNLDKWTLDKYEYGYKLYLTISGNELLEKLDKNKIFIQLVLPLKGDSSNVYINSTYDELTGYYIIYIKSKLMIKDGYFEVLNGYSDLNSKYVKLDSDCTLYIGINDISINDNTKYLYEEIYHNNEPIVVFNKETSSIKFGMELKYIWNKLYNAYNSRKYKTYKKSIPRTYDEDVYEVFENGMIHDDDLNTNILHRKGDTVHDANGNVVYKHKEGDVVLDDIGNPIIDLIGGVIRFIDIAMIEYEFLIANSVASKNYLDMAMDIYESYIHTDMVRLNDKLIENTIMLYKTHKSISPIRILVDGSDNPIPSVVSPKVILYIDKIYTIKYAEQEVYKNKIGKILNDRLEQNIIKLNDIKEEIKQNIGEHVHGVSILGLTKEDMEVIRITSNVNRFCLSKYLDFDSNKDMYVRYNIELEIKYT